MFGKPTKARKTARQKWVSTVLFVILAALALASVAAAAPIFTNGDFSTLSATAGNANSTMGANGGYICANTGNSTCVSNIAGWSSTCKTNACGTSGTVASILFAGTAGAAFNGGIGLWSVANSPTGGNYIAIDGDPSFNASISQTVTGLTNGATYAISFSMGAAQQAGTTGANTEYWDVTFGSTTIRTQVISNTSKGFQPWRTQTMNFVATSTSQVLTFLAGGTPNGGPPVVLLDGITLTEVVPEPSSFLMLAAGLATLVGFKKRKR